MGYEALLRGSPRNKQNDDIAGLAKQPETSHERCGGSEANRRRIPAAIFAPSVMLRLLVQAMATRSWPGPARLTSGQLDIDIDYSTKICFCYLAAGWICKPMKVEAARQVQTNLGKRTTIGSPSLQARQLN